MIKHNFTITNCDTDSISFRKEDGSEFTQQEQKDLLNEINNIMLKGIEFDHDGYYDTVIVIKAKNYVLKDKKTGKIKYKGSGLTDSKKEPALTEFLEKLILDLIDTGGKYSEYLYNQYIKEVMNMKDITRWATKKTVSKSVLNPTRTNEQKILDAIDIQSVQEGDKVFLYTALDGDKDVLKGGEVQTYADGTVKREPNSVLKLTANWAHDENKEHYVKRVWSTLNILKNVLDMERFPKYHLKGNKKLLDQLIES